MSSVCLWICVNVWWYKETWRNWKPFEFWIHTKSYLKKNNTSFFSKPRTNLFGWVPLHHPFFFLFGFWATSPWSVLAQSAQPAIHAYIALLSLFHAARVFFPLSTVRKGEDNLAPPLFRPTPLASPWATMMVGEPGSLVDGPFIFVHVGLLAYIYQWWCLGRHLGSGLPCTWWGWGRYRRHLQRGL